MIKFGHSEIIFGIRDSTHVGELRKDKVKNTINGPKYEFI